MTQTTALPSPTAINVCTGSRNKHGMYGTPEYRAWGHIKERCFNNTVPTFNHYGGRGITICDEWANDFGAFYRDMGPRPTANHSIERKDNNRGYSPDNCCWATKAEQMLNTRRNHHIAHNGLNLTISEWAKVMKIPHQAIRSRIHYGWHPVDAITFPMQPNRGRRGSGRRSNESSK